MTFILCLIIALVASFPGPSSTAAKCPHCIRNNNVILTKNTCSEWHSICNDNICYLLVS
jgi:hypothetical protein